METFLAYCLNALWRRKVFKKLKLTTFVYKVKKFSILIIFYAECSRKFEIGSRLGGVFRCERFQDKELKDNC